MFRRISWMVTAIIMCLTTVVPTGISLAVNECNHLSLYAKDIRYIEKDNETHTLLWTCNKKVNGKVCGVQRSKEYKHVQIGGKCICGYTISNTTTGACKHSTLFRKDVEYTNNNNDTHTVEYRCTFNNCGKQKKTENHIFSMKDTGCQGYLKCICGETKGNHIYTRKCSNCNTLNVRCSYCSDTKEHNCVTSSVNTTETYTISINKSTGGSITVSGATLTNPITIMDTIDVVGASRPLVYKVKKGANVTINVIALSGYDLKELFIDGKSVGAVSKYSLNNVSEHHSASASFVVSKAKEDNVLYGDLLEDGLVDINDDIALEEYLAGLKNRIINMKNADVNLDGKVDGMDHIILICHLANPTNYGLPHNCRDYSVTYKIIKSGQHEAIYNCSCGRVKDESVLEEHVYVNGKCVCGVRNDILYGDVLENGIVEGKDSAALRNYILGRENKITNMKNADVNLDGKVDGIDAIILKQHIINSTSYELPHNCGDYSIAYKIKEAGQHEEIYNCSCGRIKDVVVLQEHVYVNGKCICGIRNDLICGDVNGDGKVNSIDLRRIYKYFYNEEFTEAQRYGADMYRDGKIDNMDLQVYYYYKSFVTEDNNSDLLKEMPHYCGEYSGVYKIIDTLQHEGTYRCPCGKYGASNKLENHVYTNGKCICGAIEKPILYGDLFEDGIVNNKDGLALLRYVLGTENKITNMKNADVNLDGKVDGMDYFILDRYIANPKSCILPHYCGDYSVTYKIIKSGQHEATYNCPCGRVKDRSVSEAHIYVNGKCVCGVRNDVKCGDVNGDGKVNLSDLSEFYKCQEAPEKYTERQIYAADMYRDGKIDKMDLVVFYRSYSSANISEVRAHYCGDYTVTYKKKDNKEHNATYNCVCGAIKDAHESEDHVYVDGKCVCGATEGLDVKCGDVDGSGKIDETDVKMLKDYLLVAGTSLSDEQLTRANVDAENGATLEDLAILTSYCNGNLIKLPYAKSVMFGDLNGDNKVDVLDITEFQAKKEKMDEHQKICADVNIDGVIDDEDREAINDAILRYGIESLPKVTFTNILIRRTTLYGSNKVIDDEGERIEVEKGMQMDIMEGKIYPGSRDLIGQITDGKRVEKFSGDISIPGDKPHTIIAEYQERQLTYKYTTITYVNGKETSRKEEERFIGPAYMNEPILALSVDESRIYEMIEDKVEDVEVGEGVEVAYKDKIRRIYYIDTWVGDANLDGNVTQEDTIYLFNNIFVDKEKYPLKGKKVCDVNKDGNIDIEDVALIQRYVEGKIETLPYTTDKE